MSAYFIAFVAIFAAAIVAIVATGVPLALSARRLQRRARALAQHPTLVALQGFQGLDSKLRGMQASLVAIRARSERISEDTAELLATSALLRLQVERISFATGLLLSTFVPTLRGSMAD